MSSESDVAGAGARRIDAVVLELRIRAKRDMRVGIAERRVCRPATRDAR